MADEASRNEILPPAEGAETLRGVVRAFERMAEAQALLARRLTQQMQEVAEAKARLDEYVGGLERTNQGLREANLELTRLTADLDERHRALAQRIAELDRLNRLKSEFLAILSHELRTPLTSIKGALGILLEEGGVAREVQQEFLGIAQQNTERLLRLVGNLLDMAKIERGVVTLEKRSVDLSPLLSSCIASLRTAAREKGVEVHLRPLPALPAVPADEDGLRSVVMNLLDNAIRFSLPGGRIWVEAERRGGDVFFAVQDEGPGIPPEEQERIFERFYQGGGAGRHLGPGAGLGLHICQMIVSAHGGRIWVESPDRGARFCVTLPLSVERREG